MAAIGGEEQTRERANMLIKRLNKIPRALAGLEDLDGPISASSRYQNGLGLVDRDICNLACMGPRTERASTRVAMKGPVIVSPSTAMEENRRSP